MTTEPDTRGRIEADYRAALKARDADTVSALRMLKAAIQNAEIAKRAPLSDGEVAAVVRREAKVRHESREEFARAGRSGLAEREDAALRVLDRYLPAQLTEAELREIIATAVSDLAPEQRERPQAAIGPVIRKVMAETAGRAEGGTVSAMVRSAFSNGG